MASVAIEVEFKGPSEILPSIEGICEVYAHFMKERHGMENKFFFHICWLVLLFLKIKSMLCETLSLSNYTKLKL